MTDRAIDGRYPAYRAPTANESSLIDPAPTQLVASIQEAELELGSGSVPLFCGRSLADARAQARCETVQLAVGFTSRYRDVGNVNFCRTLSSESATGRHTRPIVLTGHQPELFHAGVWFKNFLTSHLAEQSGGLAINFLVDNDVCRSATIRVPSVAIHGGVVAQSIPYDEQRSGIPWELRQLSSRATWDTFPARVIESLLPLAGHPLLQDLWPLASAGLAESNRVGWALSQGRHQLERQLGLKSLEVPLSWLAETHSFARFSLSICGELPRFQTVYNAQLERYRQAHQIRNRAHPVPPLEQRHDWLETPLWVYRKSSPQRQRLWVSHRPGQLCLTDRAGWQACIEGELTGDDAIDQWRDLQADGVCLRPRALLTTMYLRLFVADLFVHGIGGGKYDQLTDTIIEEFFHLLPPPMIVASATVRLPLNQHPLQSHGSSQQTEQQIRNYRDQMWRSRYHAEVADAVIQAEAVIQADAVIDAKAVIQTAADSPGLSSEIAQLQSRKRWLLAHIPPRGEKWEWHQAITAVNRRLAELAEPKIREAKEAVEELTAVERQQRLLESREYSFSLFPREYLADLLHRLSHT